MKANVKPVVSSRPMPGTAYREHTLTLAGIELRTQMHAFTPQEIDEAVQLYLTHGITTPRHPNGSWIGEIPPTVTPRAPDAVSEEYGTLSGRSNGYFIS